MTPTDRIDTMTAEQYRAAWNPSEAEFQREVIDEAERLGYLVYHVWDSRKAIASGFPDLCLVGRSRPPDGTTRTIFAELKTNNGRLRPDQRSWLMALEKCTGVETYLWRPRDWDQVRAVLQGAEEMT